MQSSLQPGMTLQGKYKILQKIGKGGMSFVFKAFSIARNKECALKEMQDQYLDPESRDKIIVQFMNEVVTLRKLNHPGIPYVLETFEDNGKYYIAMEYVAGCSLEDVIVESPELPTQEQVLGVIWQIADILTYLHNLPEPVILRDLKPSNIMVTPEGKVQIIDFGIAKIFDQGRASRTMAKIKGSGSSGFAPPEQYGAAGTDKRTDIYAFGATIYYMLTGIILPDSVDRILTGGKIDPVKNYNPTATEAMQKMIEKMVQLKPGDRFQSIEQVKEYLVNNGMKGEYPKLKPPAHNEETAISNPIYAENSSEDLEEEKDSGIYLPKQIYKKKTSASTFQTDEQRDPESSSSYQNSARQPIKSSEESGGSGGIADALKQARKKQESDPVLFSAVLEPTRKLNKATLDKFLTDYQKPETFPAPSLPVQEESPAKQALIKTAEEARQEPTPGLTAIIILSTIIFLILGILAYITKDFWLVDPKPVKAVDEIAATETASPAAPALPPKPYIEKTTEGEITSIEIQQGIFKLRIQTDNGFLALTIDKKQAPENLKAGAEVSASYKVPNKKPNPPFEIITLEILKEAPVSTPPPQQETSPKYDQSIAEPPYREAPQYSRREPAPPPPIQDSADLPEPSGGSFTQQRETNY